MSQHVFHSTLLTKQAVRVQAGWDRPLQYYYLVVETVCDKEEEEKVICASPLGRGWHNVDAIQTALDQLGIAIPRGYLKEVWFDGSLNVGNKRKSWNKRSPLRHRRRLYMPFNKPRIKRILTHAAYAQRYLSPMFRGDELQMGLFKLELQQNYPQFRPQ